MCVGVPSRILAITPGALPMARLDVAGQQQDACLAYLPEAQVGDYVLVQGGFAMTLLTPDEAADSLRVWADLGMLPHQESP